MAKTAVIADLHLGNHKYLGKDLRNGLNQRARWILSALSGAIQLAKDQKCASIVIAGDLFDTSSPSPALIAAVMDAIRIRNSAQPHVDLLLGNHDMHSGEENALMPFVGYNGLFTDVYIDPTHVRRADHGKSNGILMAPFCVGPASDW